MSAPSVLVSDGVAILVGPCRSLSVRPDVLAAQGRPGALPPRRELQGKNRPLAWLLCDRLRRCGTLAPACAGFGVRLGQVECAAALFRDARVAPEQAEQAAPQ